MVFAGIFDRDFRPDEEIEELRASLGIELSLGVILGRKEIENYLLIPEALDRALTKLNEERSRRTGFPRNAIKPVLDLLEEITAPMEPEVQAQYIAKRGEYLGHSGKDSSTINLEAIEIFNRRWKDINGRLHIVPGKRTLSELVSRVQDEYNVSLTPAKIIDACRVTEIPSDFRQILQSLDDFRRLNP